MAVPKKKTSRSKTRMRRSHNAPDTINVLFDKNNGKLRLPHTMSSDGTYRGKVIIPQTKAS